MAERLNAKASALGLDVAAYARMLIYRDVNELAVAYAPPTREPEHLGEVATFWQPQASPPQSEASDDEIDPNEPRAEDVEIPADPDGAGLDDLLRAGPSLLDEMMAQAAPAKAPISQRPGAGLQQRQYRAPLSNRNRGAQPIYGPGSMTRAIGVNDMAIGSNNTGDGHGNVLRDNMRHFGITGTRAR